MPNAKVVIVGAGLSGLCCALELERKGINYTILEASDAVGGRVRTDKFDGFLLDRGFQIFLTAYPEAKRILNYAALNFRPFIPGATVFRKGQFHKMVDPFRQPAAALQTLLAPVGTAADKLRVASLSRSGQGGSSAEKTIDFLKARGFSDGIIDEFFKPFLGGIFLESDLRTASQRFEFVFGMLAHGDNVLPSGGMQAIPEQIASMLPAGKIKFGARVEKVSAGSVQLASGELIRSDFMVIATEEPQAARILGDDFPKQFNSQTCVYFSAKKSPLKEAILALNGEGTGLVNNLCVPSDVASSYAPSGQSLISVSIIGDADLSDAELEGKIRTELTSWFGADVNEWNHLRTYRIRYALPDQSPSSLAAKENYEFSQGIYRCGDYMETASINGAMVSGRKVAEALASSIS